MVILRACLKGIQTVFKSLRSSKFKQALSKNWC